ncbi:flavodoxin domain-containing protein [Rhodococcus sp. NCIMB 12038]|uniref:flavodoxin domain-containing protein n=1 Tax=Rhodococcus sp. NCIMB 12038 TaxID=933800 RepID=UPI001C4F7C93|nr:flavodoxin domain-containing protein [Rhodococcus sp. NCIMB 12038]
MSTIHILFGTESGNAEMVADDIAAVLQDQGLDTEIAELSEDVVADLAGIELAVFVTSTYGEGDLPESAAPFYEALLSERPDLSRLSFGAFGLGDSAYETFNNGIDTLRHTLSGLGARQIGETAKHDAASGDPASDLASTWAALLLDLVPA